MIQVVGALITHSVKVKRESGEPLIMRAIPMLPPQR